jgi:hypothetical protein
MFGSWAEIVGGVLAVAGIPAFLENAEEFYELADVESAEIRSFLVAWLAAHGNDVVGTAELYSIAMDNALDIEGKTDQARKVKLGKLLSQLRDRRYTLSPGLIVRVAPAGDRQRALRWRLERCECGESGESLPLGPKAPTHARAHDGLAPNTHPDSQTHVPPHPEACDCRECIP